MAEGVLRNLSIMSSQTLHASLQDVYQRRQLCSSLIVAQTAFLAVTLKKLVSVADASDTRGIGFLGCGILGTLIIRALRKLGVPSQDIAVSTRQPEYLSQLVDDGAAYYDNQRLVQSSKVIIIACLPGQLQRVSASVKGKLKRRTVLISILSTASPERIQTLFNHPLVVTTQLGTPYRLHYEQGRVSETDEFLQRLKPLTDSIVKEWCEGKSSLAQIPHSELHSDAMSSRSMRSVKSIPSLKSESKECDDPALAINGHSSHYFNRGIILLAAIQLCKNHTFLNKLFTVFHATAVKFNFPSSLGVLFVWEQLFGIRLPAEFQSYCKKAPSFDLSPTEAKESDPMSPKVGSGFSFKRASSPLRPIKATKPLSSSDETEPTGLLRMVDELLPYFWSQFCTQLAPLVHESLEQSEEAEDSDLDSIIGGGGSKPALEPDLQEFAESWGFQAVSEG